MLAPLVFAALAVSPGTIAIPAFRGAGLGPEAATHAAERLGQALTARHYDVVGPRQVAERLGADQQRALAACAPTAGLCFGAFFEPLGTPTLAVGVVSTVDRRLLVEVRLLGAPDGRVLTTARGRAERLADLDAALDEVALALVVDFEAAPAPPEPPPPPTLGAAFWTPVIAGGVLVVAGAIELGVALADLDRVRAARGVTLLEPDAGVQLEDAVKRRNVGIAGMGLGAASIVVGALMGRSTDPALSPAPVVVGGFLLPSGGGVAVSGRF